MADIIKRSAAHSLSGTWVNADGDRHVEFSIEPSATGIVVTGRETLHGEGFVISDVTWDGCVLRFWSVLPSTGYRAGHALRAPALSTWLSLIGNFSCTRMSSGGLRRDHTAALPR
jgi:hypothetical protein